MRRMQMARTAFQRKPDAPFNSLKPGGVLKAKKALKAKRKRVTVAGGSKYLAACRGESCYLQVVGVCARRFEDASVVPCHSNQSKHGKGMSIKAKHEFTVPGCAACHFWLDQGTAPRETKVLVFDEALEAWVPARDRKMQLTQHNTGV